MPHQSLPGRGGTIKEVEGKRCAYVREVAAYVATTGMKYWEMDSYAYSIDVEWDSVKANDLEEAERVFTRTNELQYDARTSEARLGGGDES